ncbi:hypothetical protein B0H13DRAFT_1852875 [Mycena leptocephala]|nr:hypothetical protein B0H13DRAFT_1852875 [Mycena leptocephala]
MLQFLRKAGMVTPALLMVVPSYRSAAASSILKRSMEDEGALSGLEEQWARGKGEIGRDSGREPAGRVTNLPDMYIRHCTKGQPPANAETQPWEGGRVMDPLFQFLDEVSKCFKNVFYKRAKASHIINVDSIPNPSGQSDLRKVILAGLHVVISTLPSTIPLACDSDLIASFSGNPVPLVAPNQDTWEDVIHRIIDSLMYDEGRSKNNLELSLSIRRGELGMAGLANWMEKCFFELGISLGMLESRIERLIQAMVLLLTFAVLDWIRRHLIGFAITIALKMQVGGYGKCGGHDFNIK